MAQPRPKPNKAALAFSVGAVLTSNIIGGTVLGFYADRWLGTAPWLLVSGVVLGTTSAFILLYRIVKRLQE